MVLQQSFRKKLFAHFQTGWSGRPDLTNGKHSYYSKMKNGTAVLETFGYIKMNYKNDVALGY